MATTAQHIAARSDSDLLQRLIAAAEQAGIDSAADWVQLNIGKLLSASISEGQTISDVHAYAATVREQAISQLPPPPGLDPAAVTDVHLESAISSLLPISE